MKTLNEILERECQELSTRTGYAYRLRKGKLSPSEFKKEIMDIHGHKCAPDQLTGNNNIYEFDGRYFDCENYDYENAIEVFKQITYTKMENPIGQI